MNKLKKYVNWKLTHADKTAEADGYPLIMENCKANKRMKQLEIYGNSVQDGTPAPDNPIDVDSVGELVTDVNDFNYGKYKIPLLIKGDNEITTHNIFLNEPLRKIGNYADYIDFGNKTVVRNIGTLSKDSISRLNIMKYSNASYGYTNSYRFASIELLSTNSRNLQLAYCNLLSGGGFFLNAQLTSISYSSGGFLYFRFDDENNYGVTSIQAFKEWAAYNDLLIHYVWNGQFYEPITCELPKLNAKTTVIEVDTSIAPSNAYGKYVKR